MRIAVPVAGFSCGLFMRGNAKEIRVTGNKRDKRSALNVSAE